MADISKIQATDGNVYDIKDAVARTEVTTSTSGLMSFTDKIKLDGIAEGATANIGTITEIVMNGESKGISGIVNLGTVITEHQDISGKINSNEKGNANGVASLDSNGKIPNEQIPSSVNDILEYSDYSDFPLTGLSGKLYVDTTTNKIYRWNSSLYEEVGSSRDPTAISDAEIDALFE